MRNLIVFKEVVAGVIVLLASLPALITTSPPVLVLGQNFDLDALSEYLRREIRTTRSKPGLTRMKNMR